MSEELTICAKCKFYEIIKNYRGMSHLCSATTKWETNVITGRNIPSGTVYCCNRNKKGDCEYYVPLLTPWKLFRKWWVGCRKKN